MRPVAIGLSIAAVVVTAAVVVGVVFLVGDESAGDERGAITLGAVAEDPGGLAGREVTVSGGVVRRIGSGVAIGEELEEPVLVVSRGGLPGNLDEDSVVRVSGTVRRMGREALGRLLGGGVRPGQVETFVDGPVIEATQVQVVQRGQDPAI